MFCAYCGKETKEIYTYCPHCGKKNPIEDNENEKETLDKKDEQEIDDHLPERETWKCECGYDNPLYAVRCVSCLKEKDLRTKKCPKCGYLNKFNNSICFNCKHDISSPLDKKMYDNSSQSDNTSNEYNQNHSYKTSQKAQTSNISSLGVAGFIFGVLGLFFYPLILGILAFLCGLGTGDNDSLGAVSIILGIIDVVIAIVVFLAIWS